MNTVIDGLMAAHDALLATIADQRQRIADMEAELERTERARKAWGKISAATEVERDRALSDAAALHERAAALLAIIDQATRGEYVSLRIVAGGVVTQTRVALAADHPGAALLRELAAARALRDELAPPYLDDEPLMLAIERYDAARKGASQ